MNEQQAKALLKAYAVLNEDEGLCRLHVGNYLGKRPGWNAEAHTFVCWPYSDENPIDPQFAFWFFVNEKTGEITGADAPLADLISGTVTPQDYGFSKQN